MKSFVKFCELFGFESLPAEPEVLVRYVAYQSVVLGRAIGTIRNQLSSVRSEHARFGLSLPTPSEYFPLAEVVRGATRFLSRPVRKMTPIGPRLLSCLCSVATFGSPVRCLFLLLYCTFLRLGSILPRGGRNGFNLTEHLVWGDIKFSEEGVVIRVRRTKTIQSNERFLKFKIPFLANRSLCLGSNLLEWRSALLDVGASSPVFLSVVGGNLVPMSK